MRISSNDLIKKLIRQILEATPEELALMSENLLGVTAIHDPREFYEWDITPNPETYCGAFDIELTIPQVKPIQDVKPDS